MTGALPWPDWEYTNFSFQQWQPQEIWSGLTDLDRYTAPLARQFFWQGSQDRIKAELEKWESEGWEPVDDIGPEAIKLRKSELVDRTIDFSDIVLWISTLGVALIVRLILGNPPRRYTFYSPVEFRVQMRRPRDLAVDTDPLPACLTVYGSG